MLDFGFASEREARFELCQRLRAQRLVQGLSQAELAERAGLSVSTVKLMEAKAQCTLENFMRVVIGLGLADELQALFVFQPKSIAQMEQAAQASRVRAPRKPRVAPPPIQPQASTEAPAPAVKPSA
jgi:transcriptional regulator with XRE-family HTH domain